LRLGAPPPPPATCATRVAGFSAGSHGFPIRVFQNPPAATPGHDPSDADLEKAKDAGKTVQEVAERAEHAVSSAAEVSEVKLDVTTMVENKARKEAVAAEAEKGYDLMIIGLDKTVVRKNQFHSNVAKLASGFEGPLIVADAREEHRKHPLHGTVSILVPVNGTEMSRRAAEVAITLARATKAPLTALYVTAGAKANRTRQNEEDILKDIVKLAETQELDIRTAVLADLAPDEAVRKEAARRQHNLIVMGVSRRPGEKLFLGDTAAALLENSEISLLFVAS
jgi:nucleotide-binding universal stress UspA family protein